MKILDCTLRDGGYYNNWDFDADLVDSYLSAVASSKIDMVELGLRNFSSSEFKGAHYFTTDTFLDSLNLPQGVSYGVMVDAKVILSSDLPVSQAVRKLFNQKTASPVTFVRVACHFSEIAEAQGIINELNSLGYQVIVNLMQISLREDKEIAAAVREIASWRMVQALYFADSLGNMSPMDVEYVIRKIQLDWPGSIGIHAHNNMGFAISNSLRAIDLGVDLIDSTVSGMGRGAGNAETEILLAQLPDRVAEKYNIIPVAEIAYTRFLELKEHYGWGVNLHYTLAAKLNVHPTYVQTILTDSHYGKEERLGALSLLPRLKGRTSFVPEALHSIMQINEDSGVNIGVRDLNELSLPHGKSVLLLANGESIRRHEKALRQYIKDKRPVVFSLNKVSGDLQRYCDYSFHINNSKAFSQAVSTDGIDKGVVIPLNRFTEQDLHNVDVEKVFGYSMYVRQGVFFADQKECTVPNNLSLSYALAVMSQLGVSELLLAGFDGYAVLDDRQKEVEETLRLSESVSSMPSLVSLTPTSYLISEKSIYAPDL